MNGINKQSNKLIAVYGRVSTTKQENEGTIETQLAAVHEYAAKNNYTIIKEYLDKGWSGDSIVRPQLDQLRVDAKKNIWEAVLIYDPDRLARRFSYQELVSDELREANKEIIYVTTSVPRNPEDRILFGVKGLFAEYERSKIAERFRLGKVRKAKEGNIIAAEAPYGYTFIPKSGSRSDGTFRHGYYEVNEGEAAIVKDIFTWVAKEGLTLHAVVKRLRDSGIPPRKSKRGVWRTNTLSSMLRNRTYVGEGHYGASYAVVPQNPIKDNRYRKVKKSSRRMRPKNEWISIPTPRLISDEMFEKVTVQLRRNLKRSRRNRKNEYLLAGNIWCVCNCRRTGEGSSSGKYLYYRCSDRVKRFPHPRECEEKGINVKIADALVWDMIKELMCSPELMKNQIERWLRKKKQTVEPHKVDTSSIKNQIRKLKEQEARFMNAYGEGVMGLDDLRTHCHPVQEAISKLQDDLAKEESKHTASHSTAIHIPEMIELKDFAARARKHMGELNFETKKAIIDQVVDRITCGKGELNVCGYLPITSEYHVELLSNNRNGRGVTPQKGIPFNFQLSLPAQPNTRR